MDNATSAYMVCDRLIIDCVFILRLYLCVYHSLHDHRWWSCWQAQRTQVQVFPKDEFTESMIS